MRKKYFLILNLFLFYGLLYAQVGINTKSPLGIFHIDALGNNPATPVLTDLKDDFIVNSDGIGGVGVGIGTTPAPGASVDLASSRKGLSLNTVALTGAGDLVTVPSPVQGMIVFNTATNADLIPGICVFNGATMKWEQMAFTRKTNEVKIAVSKFAVTTTPVTPIVIMTGHYAGVSIPFTPLGSSTPGIKVTADGTYGFALNLVGTATPVSTAQTLVYLFMVRQSDMKIMDAAALATLSMNNPPQYKQSACAILVSELKAGDELIFMICHSDGTPTPWTLNGGTSDISARYNKTSLSYWKL